MQRFYHRPRILPLNRRVLITYKENKQNISGEVSQTGQVLQQTQTRECGRRKSGLEYRASPY